MNPLPVSGVPVQGLPQPQGLYDPAYEKESCGVGFVANLKGLVSHAIVANACQMLVNMEHRGGCGCEANTGDGAGILTGMPYDFMAKVAQQELGIILPVPGQYAAGLVFFPKDVEARERCRAAFAAVVDAQGQALLGWRVVPTDPSAADIGPSALATEPHIEMVFIGCSPDLDNAMFERQLMLIRKLSIRNARMTMEVTTQRTFYICSLSTRLLIYKGQLTASQVAPYFPDLNDPDYQSHLAMVHSRFSTNTFPSWERAQPFRYMSHNGEINTIRGNENWMYARQGTLHSPLFGDEIQKLFPIIDPNTSDSGKFDNALELLVLAGRSLPRAVMMMIPEAWEHHESMSTVKRDFYDYHSCLMEPWDGPASVVFTDGRYIGAVLDRNGLRPSRYYITHDDVVIMASEVGVLPVPAENVKEKGRLQPGHMFLVDFKQGRVLPDAELKQEASTAHPYGEWLASQRLQLSDLPKPSDVPALDHATLQPRLQAFGYTLEHLNILLKPMVEKQLEALGSMGNDTPLAPLSDKPRLTYDYFQQLFAQVTNPPIDSIREEVIMSLQDYVGPQHNLLETVPQVAQRLLIENPILTNEELAKLKALNYRGWRSRTIDITYPVTDGPDGLATALTRICAEATAAIGAADSLLILSDRAMGKDRVAVSALLACGAVHHHLIATTSRTRIGIIVETGEAREVHHHCALVGYGADGINPYLAFEALWQLRAERQLAADLTPDKIVANYRKAVSKGMRKVMGKMGISTLRSYKGAQILKPLVWRKM
jgi:glutamate synthase (NADPH/NADH) large chain